MRFFVGFLLVITLVALACGQPGKAKEAPKCAQACAAVYEPICAKAKNGNKERLLTFGNACVLGNYNCQHSDDPFEIKSQGECGGKVSVRLS